MGAIDPFCGATAPRSPVAGYRGHGDESFCFGLARWLICESPTAEGRCASCPSCRLFDAGTHPDFHMITTEREAVGSRIELIQDYTHRYQDRGEIQKKKRPESVITIDQVRAMIENLSMGSHTAPRRVGLVMPADAMNANAANAFLKLLEEPPAGVIFILATAQPWRLPKTIVSRCLRVVLGAPDREQSLAWLSQRMDPVDAEKALGLAHGGPLLGLQIHEQENISDLENYLDGPTGVVEHKVAPVALAGAAAKIDLEQSLRWFQTFMVFLVRWYLNHPTDGFSRKIGRSRDTVSVTRLFGLYDKITHYQRLARSNFNEQLVHEELLMSLSRVAR